MTALVKLWGTSSATRALGPGTAAAGEAGENWDTWAAICSLLFLRASNRWWIALGLETPAVPPAPVAWDGLAMTQVATRFGLAPEFRAFPFSRGDKFSAATVGATAH